MDRCGQRGGPGSTSGWVPKKGQRDMGLSGVRTAPMGWREEHLKIEVRREKGSGRTHSPGAPVCPETAVSV